MDRKACAAVAAFGIAALAQAAWCEHRLARLRADLAESIATKALVVGDPAGPFHARLEATEDAAGWGLYNGPSLAALGAVNARKAVVHVRDADSESMVEMTSESKQGHPLLGVRGPYGEDVFRTPSVGPDMLWEAAHSAGGRPPAPGRKP